MTSITLALFMVAAAFLAVGYVLGAWVQRNMEPDFDDDELSPQSSFNEIEEAVEDLKELGWTSEISGSKDGTFVYYKLIAPAPKE